MSWDVLLNWIALLATVAAIIATKAAIDAAVETRRSTQAQLISGLMDTYAGDEMLHAMILLRQWRAQHGDSFAVEFQRLRRDDYDRIRSVDLARRRVSHHFYKIYVLQKQGLLSERLVRDVANQGQVSFCREVVEPLEEAIEKSHGKTPFDALAGLYGISRSPLCDLRVAPPSSPVA